MKIKSLYDKDVNVLKYIFLILLCLVVPLIVTSVYLNFFHQHDDSNDYGLSLVYNSGRNVMIKSGELSYNYDDALMYNFSVVGHNNTDSNIYYNIDILKGIIVDSLRIDDYDINIEVLGFGNGAIEKYGPVVPSGLSTFGVSIGKGYLPKQSSFVMHEYVVKIWQSNNNIIYGDIYSMDNTNDGYYSLDFKLKIL